MEKEETGIYPIQLYIVHIMEIVKFNVHQSLHHMEVVPRYLHIHRKAQHYYPLYHTKEGIMSCKI